ncbi:hypothetical protein TURU_068320 [Turdus rufiventris]|nr:hypothetical protein TURU_068320 [Turdus rufiventris]
MFVFLSFGCDLCGAWDVDMIIEGVPGGGFLCQEEGLRILMENMTEKQVEKTLDPEMDSRFYRQLRVCRLLLNRRVRSRAALEDQPHKLELQSDTPKQENGDRRTGFGAWHVGKREN